MHKMLLNKIAFQHLSMDVLFIIYCSKFLLVLCVYHENKQMKINLHENEVPDSCVASLTKN